MTAQIKHAMKISVLTYRGIKWELVPMGKRKNKKYYLVSERGNKFYYYLDDTGEIAATYEWCPKRLSFNKKQLKVLIKTLLQKEGRYWSFKDHINLLKAKIRYMILHK